MHDLGFSLFPLKNGSKIPALKWEKYQTERAIWSQIEAWRVQGFVNFAVVTGAISGFDVLDLDNAETIAEAERRGLPDTISVNTPRGRHIYFRHFTDKPIRNTVRLGDMPGADFRGDGGYVVAVGSHYVPTAEELAKGKTEGAYSWHCPPGLFDFAPAPEWLLELLATKPAAASRTRQGGVQPHGSDYAADGWAEAGVRHELATLMAAPEGARNGTLNTVAMKIGQIVGGGRFDANEAKQRLAGAAAAIGLPTDEAAATIASGFSKGLKEPRQPHECGHVATAGDACKTPANFRPLDISVAKQVRPPAPVFPLEPFGPAWGAWLANEAEGAGAPVAYVALSLLITAAGLIGNSRRAGPWSSWRETAILWGMVVGEPSAGKTPALQPALGLVAPIDADMARGFEATLANYAEKVALAKIAKERWEATVKDAIKNNVAPPPMPANAKEPPRPVSPAIVVSDCTPEKVGLLQQALPKGFLFYRDEAAGWLGNMGRYGSDGERQLWLEAYNGKQYRVDRVKLDMPIVIPRLAVSVLGGMQPERFADMMASDTNDGLIARFLIAFPDPVPPKQPKASLVPLWPPIAMRRLHGLMLVKTEESEEPITMPFSEAAVAIFEVWRTGAHHLDVVEGLAKDHWGKMPGMCIRIALVLEHLWWSASETLPEPREISVAAVEDAITLLTDYFKPSALRLYGDAATPKDLIATAMLARWIVKTGATVFNAREVRNGKGCPPMLRDAKQMQAACDGLVDAGWLLAIGGRADGGAGRQPRDYKVNPALSEAFASKAA
jgi:hypothetical protein